MLAAVPATPIIIDCDPGVDDAIALLLAFASPEDLEVLAVTTVAGNVSAGLTCRNARIIRQLAGRVGVPVYQGAEVPLVRPTIPADHFHGESGLGWMEVFEPDAPAAEGHAALAIVREVMSRPPETVSIAATGPLTNLALALRLEPEIAARIKRIVIMGGARAEGGNITPSAEYNLFADPHAAHVVLSSRANIVMFGLDATHRARATPERMEALAAIDTPAARAVHHLLEFSWRIHRELVGGAAPPLHDPCTIAWLIRPQLFKAAPAFVQVEIGSSLTMGHTAVEFRLSDPRDANVDWVRKFDADALFGLLFERLARG
jgi:purine nucleosidase